jgi:hypothetical protein
MQRTYGLNTAHDFEAALGKKKEKQTTTTTTMTTTMGFENFNFEENPQKEVMVQQCPDEKAALQRSMDAENHYYVNNREYIAKYEVADLLQTVDATVSHKGGDTSLEADERRICECRSFLQRPAATVRPITPDDVLKHMNMSGERGMGLLQRNFDAALITKQQEEATATTTTTNMFTTSLEEFAQQIDERMTEGCTRASEFPVEDFGPYGMVKQTKLSSWGLVAKLLNDPDGLARKVFKTRNITEGWQNCDQSWVVHGACGKYLKDAAEKAAADK